MEELQLDEVTTFLRAVSASEFLEVWGRRAGVIVFGKLIFVMGGMSEFYANLPLLTGSLSCVMSKAMEGLFSLLYLV